MATINMKIIYNIIRHYINICIILLDTILIQFNNQFRIIAYYNMPTCINFTRIYKINLNVAGNIDGNCLSIQ